MVVRVLRIPTQVVAAEIRARAARELALARVTRRCRKRPSRARVEAAIRNGNARIGIARAGVGPTVGAGACRRARAAVVRNLREVDARRLSIDGALEERRGARERARVRGASVARRAVGRRHGAVVRPAVVRVVDDRFRARPNRNRHGNNQAHEQAKAAHQPIIPPHESKT